MAATGDEAVRLNQLKTTYTFLKLTDNAQENVITSQDTRLQDVEHNCARMYTIGDTINEGDASTIGFGYLGARTSSGFVSFTFYFPQFIIRSDNPNSPPTLTWTYGYSVIEGCGALIDPENLSFYPVRSESGALRITITGTCDEVTADMEHHTFILLTQGSIAIS